jgi:hypothetical protein
VLHLVHMALLHVVGRRRRESTGEVVMGEC